MSKTQNQQNQASQGLTKLSDATARYDQLMAEKAKNPDGFTQEKYDELEDLALTIERLKAETPGNSSEEKTKEAEYEAPAGTEKSVHLVISYGKGFNANTGEPIAKPYVAIFSYGEWVIFKNNFKRLGYTIHKVLYDPYNEASQYVKK